MKQAGRFFLRPGVFFSQLQWSSSHWFILLAFLVVAAVDTHLGKNSPLYLQLSHILKLEYGMGLNLALWVITVAKLGLMIAGAYALGMFVWFIGNMIGKQRSKRVLFRRLAVVFTILLLGSTAGHLTHMYAWLSYVSVGFYAWGLLLAFVALREQFMLNLLETAVLGVIGAVACMSAIELSERVTHQLAQSKLQELGEVIPGVSGQFEAPRSKRPR